MKPFLTCVASFAVVISAFAQAPSAPSISQIFAFYCNSGYSFCPYGFQPQLGPVQLSDGNFYGTTAYSDTGLGGGTVWQANLSGDVSTLYNFTANGSGQYVNGSYPDVALLAGPNGNLYGVTLEGGTKNSGVFYSLTTTGTQQVLYNFCSLSGCPDEAAPIVLGGDGNFYGITASLIFKLTPEGVWSRIRKFKYPSHQEGVELIAGTDGNLYGVSFSLPFDTGKASVFRLTTSGAYKVLHTFPTLEPVTALTQSPSGTLYGVLCCGTDTGIFEISLPKKYTLLQQTPQDAFPPTLLVVGSDGNLYGLITNGSEYAGYVFAVNAQGTTIFSEQFTCSSDGCDPLSLIEASDGNFYGLTAVGGTVSQGDNANGTIFKVATGLKER
jgi:hypothetical protein